MRRLPAVLFEVGVVDLHLGRRGPPRVGQVPVGQRRAIQIERTAISEVLGGHPVVVLAHERLAARRLLPGQALAHARADVVDQLRLELCRLDRYLCTASSSLSTNCRDARETLTRRRSYSRSTAVVRLRTNVRVRAASKRVPGIRPKPHSAKASTTILIRLG